MTDTCKRCGLPEGDYIDPENTEWCSGGPYCIAYVNGMRRGLSDGLAYSLDVTLNRGCRPMYEIANDGRSDASDVLRSTLRDLQNGTERPDLVGYVNKKGASR